MAANPHYEKSLNNLTTSLIKSLVSYPETSETFEACLQFAISNFKYHHCLSVDNVNVSRSYKNLIEKLSIHSNTKKAIVLKKLLDQFLTSNISKHSLSKSDTHYGMLFLLFELSTNVLNPEYTPLVKCKKAPNEVSNFDWKSYLIEEDDVPLPGEYELDELSETDSDENESASSSVKKFKLFAQDQSSKQEDNMPISLLNSKLRHSESVINEMKSKMVFPYWDYKACQKNYGDFTFPMRVALGLGTSNIPLTGFCLNEEHVTREILCVLLGQTNLTVFPIVNEKHTVSDKVTLSHLTPEALHSALSVVCKYGDIVQNIKKFVFHNTDRILTHEAFSDALLHYYQDIKEELIKIERKIMEHNAAILITDLMKMLQPIFHQLNVIDDLFSTAIDVDEESTNYQKTSRLLASLYELMMHQWYLCQGQYKGPNDLYNKLVVVWLKTLKPYIDIIDQWISRGILDDPYKEFIVQREVTCYDSFNNEFWTSTNANIKLESSNKCFPWLFPILEDIILAGKSMEVLESTGTLFNRLDLESISNPEKSLYNQFLNSMNQTFIDPQETVMTSVSNAITPVINMRQPISLFEVNFQRLLISDSAPHEHTKYYELDPKHPVPIVMTRSLFPLVDEKCNFANKLLLKVVIEEMHLQSHLNVLQKYHLMGWGDAMHDFCISIFDKITQGEYWRELYSLNSALVDAILSSNPSANSDEVVVGLNQSNMKASGLEFMNATDIIELKYKVEWPINLIITADNLRVYNIVFQYLMKVKRALYSLEHLHFKSLLFECDQQPEIADDLEDVFTATEKAHRFCLLRAKVLRLVTCWHDFIMTNVIMQEKQTFKIAVDKADSLDVVRDAHDYFLHRLQSLCLLETNNKASKFVQGILHKILHLSIIIQSQWRRGVYDMSTSTLKKYEAQYEECSRNLSEILKSIVTRGAVPLLESLAYFFVNT